MSHECRPCYWLYAQGPNNYDVRMSKDLGFLWFTPENSTFRALVKEVRTRDRQKNELFPFPILQDDRHETGALLHGEQPCGLFWWHCTGCKG